MRTWPTAWRSGETFSAPNSLTRRPPSLEAAQEEQQRQDSLNAVERATSRAAGLPDPSKALWEGIRALEEVEELEFLGPAGPFWHSREGKWVLAVALTVAVDPSGPIPKTTSWHLLILDSYPAGSISVYPSKEGGITQTFQHQLWNGIGADDRPWREGKICPETPEAVLHRLGYSREPSDAVRRLDWFVRRTLAWIELASRGELARSGDPFELPGYPRRSAGRVAFAEPHATLRRWVETGTGSGYARLVGLPEDDGLMVIRAFEDDKGRLISQTDWGRFIEHNGGQAPVAPWLRAPRTVALDPWQAPTTWSELATALDQQGIDLWRVLERLAPKLRDRGPGVNKTRLPHLFLIGFPIPETIGEPDVRMHWLSIELPPLSYGRRFPKGFRENEKGWWAQDRRTLLAGNEPIAWAASESWASEEIGSRGYLPEDLRKRRTLLLGAGALGSALAEILVRAGLTNLTVLDPDGLEAGNLTRHTLLISDLGRKKAVQLAERLNRASPHARVEGVAEEFPPLSDETRGTCEAADLVIDCTASDQILAGLQDFAWKEECLLISFSLGFQAARLYCFAARGSSFPVDTFREAVDPWIRDDRKGKDLDNLPREGVGCWHPIFPARIDDVWMMAGVASKFLAEAVENPPAEPRFAVYERCADNEGAFAGLRRHSTGLDGSNPPS